MVDLEYRLWWIGEVGAGDWRVEGIWRGVGMGDGDGERWKRCGWGRV